MLTMPGPGALADERRGGGGFGALAAGSGASPPEGDCVVPGVGAASGGRGGRPRRRPSQSTGTDRFTGDLLQSLLPTTEGLTRFQSMSSLQPSGDLPDYAGVRSTHLRYQDLPVLGDDEFRVVDRDAPFGQSRGRYAINTAYRVGKGLDSSGDVHRLYSEDFYHTFLDAKLRIQLLIFAFAYVGCFVLFALVHLAIDDRCGLELDGNFWKAYLLSLETMVTIGYGVPDPYMEGCWEGAATLTIQSLLQLLITSFLIGVIFQRIARPQARAATILFSDHAVINRYDGAHYLVFRVCELRVQHALIEPHVRCYCACRTGSRLDRPGPADAAGLPPRGDWEFVPMRLDHPDDELGGPLLLTLPTRVMHRIDRWSPLAPPQEPPVPAGEQQGCRAREAAARLRGAGRLPVPPQRQSGAEAGGSDSCVCPACGEAFETAGMLRLHCSYNAQSDLASGIPPGHRHWELTEEDLRTLSHQDPTREEIEGHMRRGHLEVVVLVEGIDPTTSSTLQARHSYVIHPEHDIVWDREFEECAHRPEDRESRLKGRGIIVDFSRFHSFAEADGG